MLGPLEQCVQDIRGAWIRDSVRLSHVIAHLSLVFANCVTEGLRTLPGNPVLKEPVTRSGEYFLASSKDRSKLEIRVSEENISVPQAVEQ